MEKAYSPTDKRGHGRFYHAAALLIINLILVTAIYLLAIQIYPSLNFTKSKIKYSYPITGENYVRPPDAKLQYYYELKSANIQKFKLDWLEDEVTYSINRDGLNERYDYPISKRKNIYRIVTLGDSLTFGANVNTENNYPEQLEDYMNANIKCDTIARYEVINLGVPGYDVEYAAEIFNRKGRKYDPDLVIWFMNYWNLDNQNEIKIPIYNRLVSQGIPAFDEKTGSHSAYEKASEIMAEEKGRDYILNLNMRLLNRFKTDYHGRLILSTYTDIPLKYIASIKGLTGNRVHYLSVPNPAGEKGLVLSDMHPSREGHREFVDAMVKYITENVLSGCEEDSR